jgi:alcohol dehydrogenase, propanol-preferring
MIPDRMRAVVLEAPGRPLRNTLLPVPMPSPGQALLRVKACGVCRTDLHIIDGELQNPVLPLIPGHEIIGIVESLGDGTSGLDIGDRVGVPWLGETCGSCRYCLRGSENLCEKALFTGYTLNGGYAEYAVAQVRYCFKVGGSLGDEEAAPLLCAGLIGYRSYRMAGERAGKIGLYGFGAAAHIVAQLALFERRRVFAFTRPGDDAAREFALSLGAEWAGDSTSQPPEPLDAAIIFAPVGSLVPAALRAVDRGGTVVCGGIHMSDVPSFPYSILWEERVLRSVANLTRRDGEELLELAARAPVRTRVRRYPLDAAGDALADLREGRLQGAAVLTP